MERYEERDGLLDGISAGWIIGVMLLLFIAVAAFFFAHLERPLNDIHRDAVKHSSAYIETHVDQAQRLLSVASGHEVAWQRAALAGDRQAGDDEQRLFASALADLRRENDKLDPSEQPASVVAYLRNHPVSAGN